MKYLLLFAFILPVLVQAQQTENPKAIKIDFLQALNKLESSINKDEISLNHQRDHILSLMDRQIIKNKALTEKSMKIPGRNQQQRDQIQAQLALTAKQKYLRRSFADLDWDGKNLPAKDTLDLVRSFMNLIE